MRSNGVCPWCLAVQVHCKCSIWGHRPNRFCVVRPEVRTDHLCDRKLHCVVLHSNPWVVTSQGNSREFVSWSACNRVQGGQTDTCGCSGRSLLFGYTYAFKWSILYVMLLLWSSKKYYFNTFSKNNFPFTIIISFIPLYMDIKTHNILKNQIWGCHQ